MPKSGLIPNRAKDVGRSGAHLQCVGPLSRAGVAQRLEIHFIIVPRRLELRLLELRGFGCGRPAVRHGGGGMSEG